MTLTTFSTLDRAVVGLQMLVNLASYRNGVGDKNQLAIYPARYDHAPINNLARQITKLVPLTDRQQKLAVTLVTKYHKQWKKLGYDVSNISLDTPTELPIRLGLDRTQSVSVSGNMITLKFPYKPRLISQIAEFAQYSCGRIEWNKETKVWEIAATAGNVIWLDKFVNDHKFTKDKAYNRLVQDITDAYDYKSIQLDIIDDGLVLQNAPATMLAWIEDNIGAIHMSNFVQLVSASYTLAFTLSDNAVKYVIDNYGDIADMILMRRTFAHSGTMTITELLAKVARMQLHNVVIFSNDQTNFSNLTRAVNKAMPEYNVVSSAMQDMNYYAKDNKTVHITNRVIAVPADVIISFVGFMAGPARRNWFDSARKNIYYCQDMDNKIKKIIKKDESNFNYKR